MSRAIRVNQRRALNSPMTELVLLRPHTSRLRGLRRRPSTRLPPEHPRCRSIPTAGPPTRCRRHRRPRWEWLPSTFEVVVSVEVDPSAIVEDSINPDVNDAWKRLEWRKLSASTWPRTISSSVWSLRGLPIVSTTYLTMMPPPSAKLSVRSSAMSWSYRHRRRQASTARRLVRRYFTKRLVTTTRCLFDISHSDSQLTLTLLRLTKHFWFVSFFSKIQESCYMRKKWDDNAIKDAVTLYGHHRRK